MPSAPSAEPSFAGVVVGGHGRGRVLGFPTANVAVAKGAVPPVDGVYACWIRFPPAEARHGGTVSVGDNPTFDDVLERRVEAYVHDLDEDLYGREISVEPVAMLREMRRFDTIDELIARTEHDVRRSRALLAGLEP